MYVFSPYLMGCWCRRHKTYFGKTDLISNLTNIPCKQLVPWQSQKQKEHQAYHISSIPYAHAYNGHLRNNVSSSKGDHILQDGTISPEASPYLQKIDRLTLLLRAIVLEILKLKPILLYHSQIPRVLKGLNKGKFLIYRKWNKKDWVSQEVFADRYSNYLCSTVLLFFKFTRQITSSFG